MSGLETYGRVTTHSWDFLNETVQITKADAQQIVDFINQYSNDVHFAEDVVKLNIDGATTITKLKAVNFNPSWPSTIFSK